MNHSAEPCQAFLNERSFCNQFHDASSFQQAMVGFVMLVERARQASTTRAVRLLMSERLCDGVAQRGMPLRQCLNHLAGAELKAQFVDIVFNRANPEPWEPDPARHPPDGYYLCTDLNLPAAFERDVRDSSMAELAERRRRKSELRGCLLNVTPSPLSQRQHVTVDAEGTAMELACLETEAGFIQWLRQLATVPDYTHAATHPPLDTQTCLVDGTRFELTNLFNKERHVYRHRTSGDLYAVDSFHLGEAAELEVFDRFRRHKGTADIRTGQLRPKSAVPGRVLG